MTLAIRQRKNSLFYATDSSASIASMLPSWIATWLQAGGKALESLVALQEHRTAVLGNPAAWLPWNDHLHLVPPSPSVLHSSAIPACRGLPFHSTMANSRADRRELASWGVGHQVQRPCERRFVHNQ